MGALADSLNAHRESVLCKTEEALAYAHSDLPEAAQAIAAHALEVAKDAGDPAMLARASLTVGQVLELSQNHEEALEHYLGLRRELEGREALQMFLGRCCLALARLQSDEAALEPLRKAKAIGLDLRDSVLLVPASLDLACRLAILGQFDEALSELVKGRARCAALAGEASAKAFDEKAAEFEAAWGEQQFQASLRAFQSKMN